MTYQGGYSGLIVKAKDEAHARSFAEEMIARYPSPNCELRPGYEMRILWSPAPSYTGPLYSVHSDHNRVFYVIERD